MSSLSAVGSVLAALLIPDCDEEEKYAAAESLCRLSLRWRGRRTKQHVAAQRRADEENQDPRMLDFEVRERYCGHGQGSPHSRDADAIDDEDEPRR